ncbi:MAG TPA: sugar ABC transporter substrate-binding protein [Burkholderiales bacterium]|nr:sugar ABC transporter substrate-binding protein [Burkholderiales bacterium]
MRIHTLVAALAFLLAAPSVHAQKVIRVWHTETQANSQEAMRNIAKRFEAKNPGVKVEVEGLAWGDLEPKIMQSLAAGTPPELSHGQPITCAALQSKGLLLPLDEVVKAIGEANIYDQVKRVCRVGNTQYGLVHAAGTSLLIYRKDLAEKHGLKAPKTWADLVANAKVLHSAGMAGITIPGDNLFMNILLGELVKANGGVLFDKQNRPQVTSKQVLETLEFIRDLTQYAPKGWEGHGYLETFTNLTGQKAAMMFQGYGRGASLIEKNAPPNMANAQFFDVWVKPHGPSGKQPAAQVDEEPWMLFKGSRNPKEAIEFLKFFYQKENYLEYVQTVPIHLFPITKSLRADRDYQATPMIQRWKSWIEVQEGYLNNDQGKPTLVIDWDDMNTKPYLMEVLGSGILRDMVMDVAIEKKPARDAAARAQKRLEDLLRSKGHLK